MKNKNTVVLCILDGWGISNDKNFNAIACANTPNFDYLVNNFPTSQLRADGEFVGLSPGQIGNSEVGHLTIGAGRTVPMNLPKIDKAIKNNSLKDNLVVKGFIDSLKKSGGVAHIAGLFSSGGVHAHQNHIIYLANVVACEGIRVNLHLFLDGRDVPPQTALSDINRLDGVLHSLVQVATLVGRFYAMDRDNRWERVEKAYHLITSGVGTCYESADEAILSRYEAGETDEFTEPCVIKSYNGFSETRDGLFFMNFRADRARELLSALCDPKFKKFGKQKHFSLVSQNGLIEYSKEHSKFMDSVLHQDCIKNTLSECISRASKTQFKLAETEKYPHVTFFFNSGVETPVLGETRFMVPSPKVLTYDLAPEMSACLVTKKLLEVIRGNCFDFIVVNYANPDMVGHSGRLDATTKACEVVDNCVGHLYREIDRVSGTLILTSDHGNCEIMYDSNNQSPHTAHTLSKVPFTVIGVKGLSKVRNGGLSDIAPTVLDILNIKVPKDMTGKSLLKFVL